MFDKAGRFKVKITDAYCAKRSDFADVPYDAFNVAVEVEEINGDADGAWTGEVSERYGVGNASDKTQTQMTAEALASTGWDCGGMTTTQLVAFLDDIRKRAAYEEADALLVKMIGAETQATVEETKKGKLIIKYIGSGSWKPKRLVKRATPQTPPEDPFA